MRWSDLHVVEADEVVGVTKRVEQRLIYAVAAATAAGWS